MCLAWSRLNPYDTGNCEFRSLFRFTIITGSLPRYRYYKGNGLSLIIRKIRRIEDPWSKWERLMTNLHSFSFGKRNIYCFMLFWPFLSTAKTWSINNKKIQWEAPILAMCCHIIHVRCTPLWSGNNHRTKEFLTHFISLYLYRRCCPPSKSLSIWCRKKTVAFYIQVVRWSPFKVYEITNDMSGGGAEGWMYQGNFDPKVPLDHFNFVIRFRGSFSRPPVPPKPHLPLRSRTY